MDQSQSNNLPELTKLLGRGAFGEVHQAAWNGQLVAIKKLLVDTNKPDSIEKIEREIKALEQIKHSNIIEYFGNYFQDNYVYLIMKYAENGSLESFIKNQSDLPHD
jgi:mitogen-activated protein kinase kinase kinase 3